MGSWGTGLYQDDTALDVKGSFAEVSRLPVDVDELVRRMVEQHGMGSDPFSEEEVDFWLALADQLHRFGLDHPPTMDTARRIVTEGHDLAAKRDLDMSERDLAKRAKVLDSLLEGWTAPHPKPRKRKMMKGPEPFVFEPGEVWIYPAMRHAAKPIQWYYFDPETIGEQFKPDGWGVLLVLDRWHHKGFHTRYLCALGTVDGTDVPDVARAMVAPVQRLVEREYYLDNKDELAHRPRRNPMIFSTHVDKPKKGFKLWPLTRIGTVAPDADAARAAANEDWGDTFLSPAGLASLEHLVSVASFHHKIRNLSPEDVPEIEPDPELRLRDLMTTAS